MSILQTTRRHLQNRYIRPIIFASQLEIWRDSGYLFLRRGNWNGMQIIPPNWVTQSTTSYSDTTGFGEGFGYGYLWWVHGYGLNVGAISARGALGKYIIVIPEPDLVVAFINHTEFPDGPQATSAAEVRKMPDVPVPVMSRLFDPTASCSTAVTERAETTAPFAQEVLRTTTMDGGEARAHCLSKGF